MTLQNPNLLLRRAPFVRLTISLAALVLSLVAAAQLSAQSEGALPRRIRFERLTTRDGLSQMTVYTILQDRQGFVWLGTQSGLNRYDGYTFKIFTHEPSDPGSLSHSFVRVLHQGSSGDLWVGTYGGGLNRFDPATESFRRYRYDPQDPGSLGHDDVRALLEDRDGALWIGTRGGGLDRFDPATQSFTHFRHDPDRAATGDADSLGHDDVRALLEDRDGAIWIGTYGGGLYRWQPAAGTFAHFRHDPDDPGSLGDDGVRVLLEDRSGALWVGTDNGFDLLDRSSETFRHFRHDPDRAAAGDPTSLADGRVRSMAEDSSGRLWIGTRGGGLHLFDRATESFRHFRHDPADATSLSHDDVYSIYEDRSGALWLGTFDGGVNWLDPAKETFAHYRHDPIDGSSLSDDDVNDIYEDPTGALWIGTLGGGLNRFDPATETFTHHRHHRHDANSLSDDDIVVLHVDRAGVVWIGTLRGGLDRFDPATETFSNYRHDPDDANSLSHNHVYSIHEDRSGVLWIGTLGGGLNRFDPATASFSHYRFDPGDAGSLGSDDIGAIYEDRSGTLWVGTRGGLLSSFDRRTDTFTHYRQDGNAGASHTDVSCLYEDRADRLWIGTYGGDLDRMDAARQSLVRFTVPGDLTSGTVHGILEDDLGRLWLSTNRGLMRFDPAARTWTGYDVRDGLQDDQFNAGAAFRTADGKMYFGGIRGFNVFDPERFTDNSYVPPVVLTSFKIFEREVALPRSLTVAEQVELGYRENFFSFGFAALSFRRPDKNRYAYKLEDFDQDWVDPGRRRHASYTNVPPGDYVFRVKGSNNDGLWNEQGTSVRIVISPPWWETLWFRLAGLAAAAALLLTLHRSLVARNRRREQEVAERDRSAERERLIAELEAKNTDLDRFVYTVSHDLKSPLVTILGFLGLIRQDAEAGRTERLGADIGRVEDAARKMRQLVEDLLKLSRAGRGSLTLEEVPLVEVASEAVGLLAGPIAERGAEVEIAPDLPAVQGDRTQLLQLFQNLLANAVAYMGEQEEPRIEVGTRTEGGDSVVYVRDNGMGIAREDQDKIFGLFERLAKAGEGTGLGLALVQRIVEVHGGRVWVESAGPGRGSTFCFNLPSL